MDRSSRRICLILWHLTIACQLKVRDASVITHWTLLKSGSVAVIATALLCVSPTSPMHFHMFMLPSSHVSANTFEHITIKRIFEVPKFQL